MRRAENKVTGAMLMKFRQLHSVWYGMTLPLAPEDILQWLEKAAAFVWETKKHLAQNPSDAC